MLFSVVQSVNWVIVSIVSNVLILSRGKADIKKLAVRPEKTAAANMIPNFRLYYGAVLGSCDQG
jgi:hypothetical protein